MDVIFEVTFISILIDILGVGDFEGSVSKYESLHTSDFHEGMAVHAGTASTGIGNVHSESESGWST